MPPDSLPFCSGLCLVQDKEQLLHGIHEAVHARHAFERVVVSREEALEMFAENKFKVGGCW